jgi:hypothetical protein
LYRTIKTNNMKTLKENIIPLIAIPVITAFVIAAIVKIIQLTEAGYINWNK